MMGFIAKCAAAIVFAAILLSNSNSATAAHLGCKDTTFGLGRGPNLHVAMDHAVENWRRRTSLTYGNAYSNWGNTINRGRQCDGKGELIHCRIWANACK